MKSKRGILAFTLVALVVISGWIIYQNSFNRFEAEVIEGSGTVEGNSIVISTKLPGQLERMYVKEGQAVKKGQKIAKLSSKQIEAKVKQAQSQVELAEAQILSAEAALEALGVTVNQTKLAIALSKEEVENSVKQANAGLEMAKSSLKQASTAYENAKMDYNRFLALYKDNNVSKQELEQAQLSLDIATAQYDAAQNQIIQAEAALRLAESSKINTQIVQKTSESAAKQLKQAGAAYEAAVAQKKFAEAILEEAAALLEDTVILAPADGTITMKMLEEGESVNQGTPVVEIIDLSNLSLTVYVSENKIGNVKLGQQAAVYVDSFGDKAFDGKIVYISDKAEFTPKNVHMKEDRVKLVYGVKIKLEDTKGSVKPGMPADAVINR
ncbi:MAG: hypothetical protein A2Y23_07065 [Clostridiales bacterium GWB2_37_7]|nr:MAG: hypothetical protein A2Y23_07065 [Clostridiales bacterium GWB2_37_7]